MDFQLPDFTNSRVLVVGDVMLDRYWHGATSRISPEAPVPVVHVRQEEHRLGGAGNVALNIAALGGAVGILGLVGNDPQADILENLLEEAKVESQLSHYDEFPTITKLRVISRHQQLIRLDFEDGFCGVDLAPFFENYVRALEDYPVIILSDYGKGVLKDPQRFIRLARDRGRTVLIDPKRQDFTAYQGASVITPNLSEFETVVGKCRDEQEIAEKGGLLIESADIEALLVTRGEHGMTLLRRGEQPIHMPTLAREVFDVTGAGDTVISVLGAALSSGADLAEATHVANIAAGIVVGKLGTATTSVNEIHQAVHGIDEKSHGVACVNELIRFIEVAKGQGEKVVMTNGCFDILHAGHVEYLQKARELGDRLIIAVNDDASVKRLKGQERPINALQERMDVLASLRFVDWVVPFSEDTPEELIKVISPDILVKGGDYAVEQIAGAPHVIAQGGEVIIIPFKEGCSTTRVIEQIRETSE